jgi:hypothetical protein
MIDISVSSDKNEPHKEAERILENKDELIEVQSL